MPIEKDIVRCCAALQAIGLITDAYASSSPAAVQISAIAENLAMFKSKGPHGGLCKQVSDAIYRGMLNQEPPSK